MDQSKARLMYLALNGIKRPSKGDNVKSEWVCVYKDSVLKLRIPGANSVGLRVLEGSRVKIVLRWENEVSNTQVAEHSIPVMEDIDKDFGQFHAKVLLEDNQSESLFQAVVNEGVVLDTVVSGVQEEEDEVADHSTTPVTTTPEPSTTTTETPFSSSTTEQPFTTGSSTIEPPPSSSDEL